MTSSTRLPPDLEEASGNCLKLGMNFPLHVHSILKAVFAVVVGGDGVQDERSSGCGLTSPSDPEFTEKNSDWGHPSRPALLNYNIKSMMER